MSYKPIALNNISCYLLYHYDDKEDIYSIGNIEKDKYIEVKESNKDVILYAISQLNGKNTIDEVEQLVREKLNCKINVRELVTILEKAALLEGADETKVEKGEFDILSFKLVKCELLKYENIFRKLQILVNPVKVMVIVLTVVALLYGNILSHIKNLNIFQLSNNYIFVFVATLIIMGISMFIHEMSHGIVAYKYGLIPKQLVVSLYLYISPIVYLKIPGIYTVNPKTRVKIWSAGIVSNLFLASLGIVIYNIMGQLGRAGIISELFLLSFYVNFVLIISNLFPLLPLDGYFIMSTLMKMPNLRKQSFVDFKNMILGKKVKFKAIYFIYFFLSAGIMTYIIGTQVFNAYNIFTTNLKMSNSFMQSLWAIKFYIIIILLFVVSKIKRFINIG